MCAIVLHPPAGRDDPEWEGFLDGPTDGTLFHRPSFLGYHPPGRFREHWLRAERKGRTIGIVPLAERETPGGLELVTPYGGSFGGWATPPELTTSDHLALLDALREHARDCGASALVVSSRPAPYRIYGDGPEFAMVARGGEVVAREVTHIAPLGEGETANRARIRGTSRRGARKAQRLGTTVRRGDPGDLPAFHEVLVEDRARLDSRPTHTAAELDDLWSRRPEDLLLLLAENGGELAGGILVFRATPHVALGFYTARASRPTAERCMNLLLERALSLCGERGQAWFDFGTSSIGGVLNPGLAEFKEGFGGLPFLRETWRVPSD
jgi:hypothetical protein